MNTIQVPFSDLGLINRALQDDFSTILEHAIEYSQFIGGDYVRQFEQDFCRLFKTSFCISCANGTDALYVALKALGISNGDEVITTSLSWISTSEVIIQAGATPVFIDIDQYATINASLVREAITNKTKAIIPVHLYGQSCDMSELLDISKEYNIPIIEDCAQAHLTKYGAINVGNFGLFGTYSFYPAKNLGALGDAGCIVCNDDKYARFCQLFTCHGAATKHNHEIHGINSRLDSLQAAFLSLKMRHLEEWTDLRIKAADYYTKQLLRSKYVDTPLIRANTTHTFHVYSIQAPRKTELKKYLLLHGIVAQEHYPTALPFLTPYAYLGHARSDFPCVSSYLESQLSLPLYPGITQQQQDYVISKIFDFYDE